MVLIIASEDAEVEEESSLEANNSGIATGAW